MKNKYTITMWLPLILIVLVELYLAGFITLKYEQNNKNVMRNVESIRASDWGTWYVGKELSQLEAQIKKSIYLNKQDNEGLLEKLDFLIVSYEFLALDVKISPLLQRYAVNVLQENIDKLDEVTQQVLLKEQPINHYPDILAIVEQLKLGHDNVVFFELKGSDLNIFTDEVNRNQQVLLYIIYTALFMVTVLITVWLVTYLNFKRTQKQSNMDELTQLPNRKHCMELITVKIQKKKQLCCLFIDLNGFKQVNDTLGHHTGDEVLKTISKRVSYSIGDEDIFARIGGDEFVLILCDYGHDLNVQSIVERIIKQIQLPMYIDGEAVNVGCAIGISFLSKDVDTVNKLFLTADSAMYVAKGLKEGNSSNYQYY
jgi:diguanylate cyclase (GGDEF)-like protein